VIVPILANCLSSTKRFCTTVTLHSLIASYRTVPQFKTMKLLCLITKYRRSQ
jgi:hypothetical protein